MEIVSPVFSEWSVFLAMAAKEGWRVPGKEIEFYLNHGGAFVLRKEEYPIGFVSVVAHEKSGWIGNLLVSPDFRGQGYGRALFEHAKQVLRERGVKTLWLTASPAGRPLYEKFGFVRIGGVERWCFKGSGKGTSDICLIPTSELLEADAIVWEESRQFLLKFLAGRGKVLSCGGSIALLQEKYELQVLGPWFFSDGDIWDNAGLLEQVLSSAEEGTEVVADVLESSPVRRVLSSQGEAPRGRVDLMACGTASDVNFESMVALASLGSMG